MLFGGLSQASMYLDVLNKRRCVYVGCSWLLALTPPLPYAYRTQRAFHVTGEGYLQMSFVVVNRGNEWKNGPGGELLYTRGKSEYSV